MAHVLLAEDNGNVADTLALLLEREGHEVHVVDDGVVALIEAARRLPDAAVLDIGLAFLDGIQVARRLRQQYGDTLRLIACTTHDDDGTRRKIVQAGFDVGVYRATLDADSAPTSTARISSPAPAARRLSRPPRLSAT